MIIVIINGKPESGKDTFIEYCRDNGITIEDISTIDPIKEVLCGFGWNGEKSLKSREHLSCIKRISVEYGFIKRYITRSVHGASLDYDILFIQSREPKEIRQIKDMLNGEHIVKTLLVKRNIVNETSNESDRNVDQYEYGDYIYNCGSLNELKQKAEMYIKNLARLVK